MLLSPFFDAVVMFKLLDLSSDSSLGIIDACLNMVVLSPLLNLLTELVVPGEFIDVLSDGSQSLSSQFHLLVIDVDVSKSSWLITWESLDVTNDLSDLISQLLSLWRKSLISSSLRGRSDGFLSLNQALDGLTLFLSKLVLLLLDVLEVLDDVVLIGQFNLGPSVSASDIDVIDSVLDSLSSVFFEFICIFLDFLSVVEELLDVFGSLCVVLRSDLGSGLPGSLGGVDGLLNILSELFLGNLLSWAQHLSSLWLGLDDSWGPSSSDDLLDVTSDVGGAWLESFSKLISQGLVEFSIVVCKINPVVNV